MRPSTPAGWLRGPVSTSRTDSGEDLFVCGDCVQFYPEVDEEEEIEEE